jgi:hypothetical protein
MERKLAALKNRYVYFLNHFSIIFCSPGSGYNTKPTMNPDRDQLHRYKQQTSKKYTGTGSQFKI